MQSHQYEAALATVAQTARSRLGALPAEILKTASAGPDEVTPTGARQDGLEEVDSRAAGCMFCRYRGPGMGKVELP